MLTEAQQQLHCKNCRPNYCTAKNEEKVRLQGAATIANAIIAPIAIAILENGQGSRHRANSVASRSGVTIIASQNQEKTTAAMLHDLFAKLGPTGLGATRQKSAVEENTRAKGRDRATPFARRALKGATARPHNARRAPPGALARPVPSLDFGQWAKVYVRMSNSKKIVQKECAI